MRGRRAGLPEVSSAELSSVAGPELSVVICSLNRRDLVLDSVRSVQTDAGPRQIEILAIDNGSKDGSREALQDLARSDSRIHVLWESRLGLSHARNAGISAARGGLVAFIDDDAIVVPGWTNAVIGAFASGPGIAALGGKSTLAWPNGIRPSWLPVRYEPYYSGVDYGDRRMLLDPPRIPYGVNMAFRRSWLVQLGGFDTRLGRRGRSLISSEEQELFLRLRAEGGEIWYEPGAEVLHRVPPERTTRRWVARRAFAQGLTHGLAPHLRAALRDPAATRTATQPAAVKPALAYRVLLRAAYEVGCATGRARRVRTHSDP